MNASADHRSLDVVVIDDVCRFPIHVWRHLSESLAFGVGGVRDGTTVFRDKEGPSPLKTPSGDAAVWWVDAASDGWEQELRETLNQISNPRLFLLDVRGAITEVGSEKEPSYNLLKAVEVLEDEGGVQLETEDPEVLLVSSYELIPPADLPLPVHAKTAETLALVAERVRKVQQGPGPACGRAPDRVRCSSGTSAPCLHVLVTGAGFELEGDSLAEPMRQPGMPTTDELLAQALEQAEERPTDPAGIGRSSRASDRRPFKVPEELAHACAPPALRQAAWDRKLDEYWNELLAWKLRPALGGEAGQGSARDRSTAKLDVSREERRLREAFRQRFLHYDWGYLRQAIQAAEFPFCAWLSTNYTRFADRAIDLWRTRPGRTGGEPETANGEPDHRRQEWDIISTSNEATFLIRKLLHQQTLSNRHATVAEDPLQQESSYLFKLHGDIGHLTTMAIAGDDKDVFSPLSFPVDSLHQVYTAAALFLERQIEHGQARASDGTAPRPCHVLWHVVGHGLNDHLLIRHMARVVKTSGSFHRFVLVSPDPPSAQSAYERLKQATAHATDESTEIGWFAAKAREYMAWVTTARRRAAPENLEDWWAILKPGLSELPT